MAYDPTAASTAPPTTPTSQIPLADDLSANSVTPVKSNGCRNVLIGCGCLTALVLAGTFWVVIKVFNWMQNPYQR